LAIGVDLMANFKVKMNKKFMKKLTAEAVTALEETAEAVKTDVIKAQVIPFDSGALQNDSTFVDTSESKKGIARLVSDTPYARRVYFHPEFKFQKVNNKNAKGEWYNDWLEGNKKNFAKKTYKRLYKEKMNL
jgi:hypothetical protein